jgi:hypothetical protein
MSVEEGRRQPMPPELEARLRPNARVYKAGGTGYALERYVAVVRQVHETREGCTHVEDEFPNVHRKHVEQVPRKQAHENGLDVAVGYDGENGVFAMYAGRDGLIGDSPDVSASSTSRPRGATWSRAA